MLLRVSLAVGKCVAGSALWRSDGGGCVQPAVASPCCVVCIGCDLTCMGGMLLLVCLRRARVPVSPCICSSPPLRTALAAGECVAGSALWCSGGGGGVQPAVASPCCLSPLTWLRWGLSAGSMTASGTGRPAPPSPLAPCVLMGSQSCWLSSCSFLVCCWGFTRNLSIRSDTGALGGTAAALVCFPGGLYRPRRHQRAPQVFDRARSAFSENSASFFECH